MELNKAACEAAAGAFAERLTPEPSTSDLLAALRFALEAYESVRLAAAPASQQDAAIAEFNRLALGVGWTDVQQDHGFSSSLFELRDWFLSGVNWALSSRAQRTNEET